MLKNQPIRPVAHDLDRRWISDDYFDLILWYAPGGEIHGFQLCYDIQRDERALTWTHSEGFLHAAIDTGESSPNANRTPILASQMQFPAAEVRTEFAARSGLLPSEIRNLVLEKITEYTASNPA